MQKPHALVLCLSLAACGGSSTSPDSTPSAAPTPTPALPVPATPSHTLIGKTAPTDNLGHVGFLGNASLTANFSNQTVVSTLDLGINNQVWQG